MQNKENRTRKKSQQRTKSFSHDRAHKNSNFTSLIFESGRNSLCSPRVNSMAPPSDRHDNYMQYITTDKVNLQGGTHRASLASKTRKSVTPTPRNSFTSQFAHVRKCNMDKQNSKAKPKNSKNKQGSKSPFAKYKPLFVKGNNIAKVQGQKKKEVNRPASVKKREKTEKIKAEDKEEQKQRKLVEKLFKGIQFHRDLGKGAHALVKSGVDWNNKRKIAVKIYDKNQLRDNQLRSIEREIQILGSLNHPSIIKLYQIIESFKKINLVMQYGGGNSVDQFMRNKKRGYLEEAQAKNIFRQILQGVGYLHENGIAHRDIKTDNILLNKYLKVKIIDFGFSIKVEGPPLVSNFCGTPTYMPPEVTLRQPYNPFLSDRWSLGILLYNMLSGHCPFKAVSQKQLFLKICDGQYEFESHLSAQARQLIGGFLVVNPEKRVSPQEALKYKWLNFS